MYHSSVSFDMRLDWGGGVIYEVGINKHALAETIIKTLAICRYPFIPWPTQYPTVI